MNADRRLTVRVDVVPALYGGYVYKVPVRPDGPTMRSINPEMVVYGQEFPRYVLPPVAWGTVINTQDVADVSVRISRSDNRIIADVYMEPNTYTRETHASRILSVDGCDNMAEDCIIEFALRQAFVWR